ncbi:SDR family NAD(P)-dependent oxidoreductase [Lentzea nigeriaca]|uniref:SDR family NAD(P)-dependent oxidoreductase n=1 Tax=Lentzea nigeriaca TaxID=1128665 RepID=UPI00195A96E7|nr:SDR family oxidoreductase [Lentzea nigeriaca]MBM7862217.1 NAD(P)-dependent dehydrogenase (short-subunit alcohol dehydrogenase family) [Lentzea nigeriaca]
MLEPAPTRLGLDGKIAIVAGGTRGLGLAVATKLCDNGVHVVVPCPAEDPDAERAQIVLGGRPGPVTFLAADTTRETGIRTVLAEVTQAWERLDLYVHLVTSPDLGPLVGAADGLAKAFDGGGRVVVAGYTVTPVAHAVRELALNLAQHRVAVNAVVTPVVDHGSMNTDPELMARLAIRCPSGRLTVPDDVADAVALLCTDEAAWIQGEVITVDGGLGLRRAG